MNRRCRSGANCWTPKKERRDGPARNNGGYKRPMSRKRRRTVQKCAKASTAVSGSHSSKSEEAGKKAVAARSFATSFHPDSLEGDFVQRLHSSPCGLSGEDEKNVSISQSIQSSTRRKSRRQEQRRGRIEHRQRNRKGDRGLTVTPRPLERQTRALKEAGLPSNRLWKFSHRNKARRTLQVEPEPDESKLIWFDLGKSDL